MKKYIMFFISIGLLLGIVLVYNTMNVEESKKVSFSESGYILNSSSDRFYFNQDETYTTSYNDKIVFLDTEGMKVTLDNENFIHYSSGSIVGLQNGVLLDFSKINEDPIIYYNISSNKVVKKISKRYTVKNLDADLQFEQGIWKISANKYIVLGEKIKLNLNNGTSEEVKDYIEIEYSDNEIVNIYNQEISYTTISSDTKIELDNNIVINLGTKIISQKDENKMSLEDMVIDSNDNVTLIDLSTKAENETKEENTDKNTENSTETINSSTQSTTNSSTTNSNSQTTINGNIGQNSQETITGNENNNDINSENKIEIDTPEIKYDQFENDETEVDPTENLDEPKFKLQNMELTPMGITGIIKITDENDLLSKDKNIVIKIINNETGKQVYTREEAYGLMNISIAIQSLLPDTQYTIVATATYIVNDIEYTKNFIYKTFKTTNIGINLEKAGFTDTEMNYNVSFTDSRIGKLNITILDSNGNELEGREQQIKNTDNDEKNISFGSLSPNTEYKIKIYGITFDGTTMGGDNWTLYYNDFKTLKQKPSIEGLNYSIDKRKGQFELYIDEVTDKDDAIKDYTYQVFKCKETTDENGHNTLIYDTDDVVYSKNTTNKQISVKVEDNGTDNEITKENYYAFKVIANANDNEKDIEVESEICGSFILEGKTFPRIKFVKEEITANSIKGKIYISDGDKTIEINNENPLTIYYKNDIGDEKTLKTITDLETIERGTDDNGEFAYIIPINEKKLKSETSYVISAYGTVDLNVNGDEQILKDVFIGSAIVTTGKYKELTAHITERDVSTSAAAFSVGFQLDGEEFEKENLSSITFIMQQGMTFNPSNEYYSKTITNNDAEDYKDKIEDTEAKVEDLRDLICDNKLIITPSLIAGKESDYKSSYYILLATVTVDGVEGEDKYLNKIPITCEEKQVDVEGTDLKKGTGNTTYIDANTSEGYSAVYIVASGKPITATLPSSNEKTNLTVVPIISDSKNSESMGTVTDGTTIGYKVQANFKNTGTMKIEKVVYYVWDENMNPVVDEQGVQISMEMIWYGNTAIPIAIFNVDKGTKSTYKDDYKDGKLHRGCSYRFSYTIIYKLNR